MTTDAEAAIQFATQIHEHGHLVAYQHFGVSAVAIVFALDNRPVDPASGGSVAGICCKSPLRPATKFQDAVAAWCGILAELVAGVPNPTIDPGYPLTAATLREVYDAIITNCEKLSPADQQLIGGYRPSTWVTFKAAWKLIRRQKAKLIRLANMKTKPLVPTTPEPPMTENQSQTASPRMQVVQLFDRYVSRAYRAILAQEQLAKLAPNDPDREVYVKALEFLRRDVEPPTALLVPP